jgi:hypothetical protein
MMELAEILLPELSHKMLYLFLFRKMLVLLRSCLFRFVFLVLYVHFFCLFVRNDIKLLETKGTIIKLL